MTTEPDRRWWMSDPEYLSTRCTCDGTPPGLPVRSTVSGHHETCPINAVVERRIRSRIDHD